MILNDKLYNTCKEGNLDVIHLLTKYGANDFNLGLRGACKGGYMDAIHLMIEKGADDFNEGLIGACKGGYMDAIHLMIEKGADDFNRGLCEACKGGHMDAIHLMIEKGADDFNEGLIGACKGGPAVRGCTTSNPEESRMGHMDAIHLMIEKGANDFNWGLCCACEGGKIDAVYLMIEKGATNLNIGLRYACAGEHIYIINMMIEKGAIIDFRDMKELKINNLLHLILYSNKVKYGNNKISINNTVKLLLKEKPREEIKELLKDYQKGQLWKSSRNKLFPDKIKNTIFNFMISIKIFSKEILKQKIPELLLWIIINLFIKN